MKNKDENSIKYVHNWNKLSFSKMMSETNLLNGMGFQHSPNLRIRAF